MPKGTTRGRHQYCESRYYVSTTLDVHIVQAASARRHYRTEWLQTYPTLTALR
jgi:hypothetical protein